MAYKTKSTNNTEEKQADIDTLRRYYRLGIPLMVEQMELLKSAGPLPLTQDQIHEKARKEISEFLNSSSAGNRAMEGCYYTEFLDYLYKNACSKLSKGEKILLQEPQPIPPDWVLIGQYRKESEKKSLHVRYSTQKKEGEYATPPLKTKLDLEIERQMQVKGTSTKGSSQQLPDTVPQKTEQLPAKTA